MTMQHQVPRPLDLVALTALGIAAPPLEAVAQQRAYGVLHHLAAFVSLGRRAGLTAAELARWSLDQAAERGYYEEWLQRSGSRRLDAFLGDFLHGRRMLYDQSEIYALTPGYEVRTALWFHRELPESLFYFGLGADELSDYVVLLGAENARRCGVHLELRHVDGIEIATMTDEGEYS